jgi:LacI family transcriptional regulator
MLPKNVLKRLANRFAVAAKNVVKLCDDCQGKCPRLTWRALLATIYDVGKRAGVSVATVSSVVNNSSYVSPELRKRVEDAIHDLDYSPNLLARGLARQITLSLGVLVPDIANFFFPEVVRGVEDKAKAAGYTIILGNSDNQRDKEELYLKLFLSNRVDGILLVKAPGALNPELLRMLKKSGIPLVLLDREYTKLGTDSVVVDDVGGGYMATRHLLDLGHRRIGIIRGIPGVSTTDGRVEGYRKALTEARLRVDPALIATGDYGIDSGYAAGVQLLDQKATAVFVTNYMMTIGFLKALDERKLRTPDDISIVSYDDFVWNSVFTPRLTCIAQPKYQLGCRAAEMLLSRIQKKHTRRQSVVLTNTLQVRSTTKARSK